MLIRPARNLGIDRGLGAYWPNNGSGYITVSAGRFSTACTGFYAYAAIFTVFNVTSAYHGIMYGHSGGTSVSGFGIRGAGNGDIDVGTVKMNARESVAPSAGKLRSLLGVQVNLFALRVFTHINLMPDRGLVGVVVGARLAW